MQKLMHKGYEAVYIDGGYGMGSVYVYDRTGKMVVHATTKCAETKAEAEEIMRNTVDGFEKFKGGEDGIR